MTRRGLTLLEVLLAVALLAMLAGVLAGVTTDLRRSAASTTPSGSFDIAVVLAPRVMDGVELPLREWPVGRTERVAIESRDQQVIAELSRVACDSCPDGFGLFEIGLSGITLRRFAEVAPPPEQTP